MPGSFLSLIPLRHMRDEAIRAGVPIKTELPEVLKEDFAEDPSSKSAFQVLCRRFDLYMKKVGRTVGAAGRGDAGALPGLPAVAHVPGRQ
ncbi:hypothetical protein ACN28S_63025 [Cystobacter fuscus]